MTNIKQNPENPIEPEVLAEAIVAASANLKKLLNSGLNRRAIVVLLAADTGYSKRDVELFLTCFENLAVNYTNKKSCDDVTKVHNDRKARPGCF